MATVKDLAAYVCDKLAGKVLIHRYDAYSTNSVYLKFDYGLGNSLRLSDHTGKAGLNYRFNIITTLKSLGIETSGEYPRFYLSARHGGQGNRRHHGRRHRKTRPVS